MVGAGRLELPISCSQSRRASHYATPRGVAESLGLVGPDGHVRAGVAQRQSPSLPSWWCGFDSRRPLWLEAQVSGLPARFGCRADAARATSVPQRATARAVAARPTFRFWYTCSFGVGSVASPRSETGRGFGSPRDQGAAMTRRRRSFGAV